MKDYEKMSGKELQGAFEEIGINALWIKGRGMIFMTSYYGVDTAVQGDYRLYTRQTAADALRIIESTTSESVSPAAAWSDLRSSDWLERTQPCRGLYRVH